MLQQLLHIIFISFICVCWGLPVLLIFRKPGDALSINNGELILSFFTGLSLISLFAAWTCVWLPLTWMLITVATLVPLTYLIIAVQKNHRLFSGLNLKLQLSQNGFPLTIFAAVSVVLFLILSSNSPAMIDTDLYHLQIIRWDHEFGTVPGLANLYLRYGFYTNWLSLISIFALPFKNDNFLYLNVTLSCWLLAFLTQKLAFFLRGYTEDHRKKFFCWAYLLIILLLFLEWGLLRLNSSSTSYDFIVTSSTLILLLLIAEEFVFNFIKPYLLPAIIAIASAIPFFKLSGITIIVIMIAYFFVSKKKTNTYLGFGLMLAAFAIPFLWRNYLQTGYPLFPYSFLSWGHPDWQVPLKMTERIARYITLNNKFFNQSIPETEWLRGSLQWIKSWFFHIPHTNQLIVVLVALGLPVFAFYPSLLLPGKRKIIPIYAGCWVAVLLWFFLSPDPRFAFGYLLFLGSFSLSLLFQKFYRVVIPVSLYSLTIAITIYGVGKFNPAYIFLTKPITATAIDTVTFNNFTYHVPAASDSVQATRCFYTDLPCIYQINPYLEPKGNKINEGFRMRESIDSAFIINYRY